MTIASKPIESFGSSSSPTNPFTSTPAPRFADLAAPDQSAPGLFSARTFGQAGGGNGSGTTGAMHAITPTSAGSTAALGYLDPSEGHGGTRGSMSGGGSSSSASDTTSQSQFAPDQEIGIPPAAPGAVPPAKQAGPSANADAAIRTENDRQGNAPDYTIGGNMAGQGSRIGSFNGGRVRQDGSMAGDMPNGGSVGPYDGGADFRTNISGVTTTGTGWH